MLNKNFILFFVGFYPIAWFVGLSLIYFQCLITVIFLTNYRNIKYVPKIIRPLLVFLIVYITSLLINISVSPIDRLIASFNNLTVWIFGILLVVLAPSIKSFSDQEQLVRLSKYFLLMVFFFGISALTVVNEPLIVNSLIGYLVNPEQFPQLVTDSLRLKIFSKDWFLGSSNNRNAIFSPYSTATAAVSIILFAFVTLQTKVLSRDFLFWASITIICVLSTYSRLLIVIFLIYLLLISLLEVRSGKVRFLIITLSIFVTTLFLSQLYALWQGLNDMRAGSSDIRFQVYEATIDEALSTSPLIGVGIKSRGDFFIPLGSHSTYLGVLLKTGLLGLSCLVMFAVGIIRQYIIAVTKRWNNPKGRLLALLVSFLLFMIFEDIDAAPLLGYLYFFSIALYFKHTIR